MGSDLQKRLMTFLKSPLQVENVGGTIKPFKVLEESFQAPIKLLLKFQKTKLMGILYLKRKQEKKKKMRLILTLSCVCLVTIVVYL